MRYQAAFLSPDEQARVHEGSLRILAEVGLRFHGERALPLLRDAGAQVDEVTGIARIPRAIVEAAVAGAPRSFVLGARNPAFDYPLPSPVSRYAMDGTAAFMRDFETGERRYGTRADIEHAMRVFQAADMGVLAWPPVAASDRPVASRPLHEFSAMLSSCSKHGQHELHTRQQAPGRGAQPDPGGGGPGAGRISRGRYVPPASARVRHDGSPATIRRRSPDWRTIHLRSGPDRIPVPARRCVPTMYGTIARLHPKPGRLDDLLAYGRRMERVSVRGFRSSYFFRPDKNPYERPTVFLVALFDDEATYKANADSPEQNDRYLELRALLEDDPDWMDGTFDGA